jgi:hypothetical protein
VDPWGVLVDRKAQPQTVAERYQKTPAEIEALKRQNACFSRTEGPYGSGLQVKKLGRDETAHES